MKSKRKLTYEERYALGFMRGYRIGRIQSIREIFINILRVKEKEQSYTVSKATICKINREVDVLWMRGVMLALCKEQMSLKALESCYDRLFLVADAYPNPVGLEHFDKRPLQETSGV